MSRKDSDLEPLRPREVKPKRRTWNIFSPSGLEKEKEKERERERDRDPGLSQSSPAVNFNNYNSHHNNNSNNTHRHSLSPSATSTPTRPTYSANPYSQTTRSVTNSPLMRTSPFTAPATMPNSPNTTTTKSAYTHSSSSATPTIPTSPHSRTHAQNPSPLTIDETVLLSSSYPYTQSVQTSLVPLPLSSSAIPALPVVSGRRRLSVDTEEGSDNNYNNRDIVSLDNTAVSNTHIHNHNSSVSPTPYPYSHPSRTPTHNMAPASPSSHSFSIPSTSPRSPNSTSYSLSHNHSLPKQKMYSLPPLLKSPARSPALSPQHASAPNDHHPAATASGTGNSNISSANMIAVSALNAAAASTATVTALNVSPPPSTAAIRVAPLIHPHTTVPRDWGRPRLFSFETVHEHSTNNNTNNNNNSADVASTDNSSTVADSTNGLGVRSIAVSDTYSQLSTVTGSALTTGSVLLDAAGQEMLSARQRRHRTMPHPNVIKANSVEGQKLWDQMLNSVISGNMATSPSNKNAPTSANADSKSPQTDSQDRSGEYMSAGRRAHLSLARRSSAQDQNSYIKAMIQKMSNPDLSIINTIHSNHSLGEYVTPRVQSQTLGMRNQNSAANMDNYEFYNMGTVSNSNATPPVSASHNDNNNATSNNAVTSSPPLASSRRVQADMDRRSPLLHSRNSGNHRNSHTPDNNPANVPTPNDTPTDLDSGRKAVGNKKLSVGGNAPKKMIFNSRNSKSNNNNDVTSLTFQRKELDRTSAIALSYALRNLPNPHVLLSLDLSHCKLQSFGGALIISTLSSLRHLRSLNVSSNALRIEEARSLTEHLQHLDYLKVLDISDNLFFDRGILALIPSLCKLTRLTDLNLSCNHFGSDSHLNGLNATLGIARIIKRCGHLKQLDLRKNRIGKEGLRYITYAMKDNCVLTTIHMQGNPTGHCPDYYEAFHTVLDRNGNYFMLEKEAFAQGLMPHIGGPENTLWKHFASDSICDLKNLSALIVEYAFPRYRPELVEQVNTLRFFNEPLVLRDPFVEN